MVPNLVVAFFTGLTAGGIGCVVVQGGLLAGCLARHFDRDERTAENSGHGESATSSLPGFALTISLFLLAKLITYTFLGFLLGAFGSFMQLTPLLRAVLMISIGIFIVGNGMHMLGVHPIFRWLVLEPPHSVTRFVRRASRSAASPITPIFMGALTVLLPCGISQAMMAAALGTGDPLKGATLMFAFTLGTVPIFFFTAYFATRLGAVLEAHFTRIVGLILIVLGGFSFFQGFNLIGFPLSPSLVIDRFVAHHSSSTLSAQSNSTPESDRGYAISVSDRGYQPKVLHLPAEKQVTIVWAPNGDSCCARSLVVPGLGYQTILPPSGRVPLTIAPQKPGTVLFYSCSTGRFTGQLVFDLK